MRPSQLRFLRLQKNPTLSSPKYFEISRNNYEPTLHRFETRDATRSLEAFPRFIFRSLVIRENIGRRFDIIPNRISALITEECVRLFFELTSRFQQTLLRLLRGNDAEMKGGRGDCDVRQQRQLVLAAFLKKGGPRVLNASHYFDDLFRLAKHARAHPAIGLVKHSSSLSRCTRAHTPLAQPNLVITYRFRVVVSLSPRYRFSLCRSAADKAASRNLPSIRPFVYVYIV